MVDGQEDIYYLTADNLTTARNSPHLEGFRSRGIEVLLLTDEIDEWVVHHLTEFDDKALQSVAKGELDLGEDEDSEKELEEKSKSAEKLLKRISFPAVRAHSPAFLN